MSDSQESGSAPVGMKRLVTLVPGGSITILEGGELRLGSGAILQALPEGGLAIDVPDDVISHADVPIIRFGGGILYTSTPPHKRSP